MSRSERLSDLLPAVVADLAAHCIPNGEPPMTNLEPPAVPDTEQSAAEPDIGMVLRDLADDLEAVRVQARTDGEVQRAVGIGDALDMLRSRIARHPRRSGDTGQPIVQPPLPAWLTSAGPCLHCQMTMAECADPSQPTCCGSCRHPKATEETP